MSVKIKILIFFLAALGYTAGVASETAFASDALHRPFGEILKTHVSDGNVNYAGIKADPRFVAYIDTLEQTRPDSLETNSEKLAFWINTYNALAIKGILDGLSPSTLLGRYSYFKGRDYNVGGMKINLYDLERKVIIPFDEPRIHFAIVCASYSCPRLRPEAYLAAKLESQLQENTIDFLNDPEKNNFNAEKKRANLSKIFDWFKKDFEEHSGSVQKYVAPFVRDETHRQALQQEKYKVKHLKYRWTLNGSPAS